MSVDGHLKEILSFVKRDSESMFITNEDTFAKDTLLKSIDKTLTAKNTTLVNTEKLYSLTHATHIFRDGNKITDLYFTYRDNRDLVFIKDNLQFSKDTAFKCLDITEHIFHDSKLPIVKGTSAFFNIALRMVTKPLEEIKLNHTGASNITQIVKEYPFEVKEDSYNILPYCSNFKLCLSDNLSEAQSIKAILNLQTLIIEYSILKEIKNELVNLEDGKRLEVPLLSFITY